MNYLYYPGCSATSTCRAYGESAQAVVEALGLEMPELADWNCCGSSAYFSIDKRAALAFAGRNLALAERQLRGGGDLVTICAGCYSALGKVNRELAQNPLLRKEIGEALAAAGLGYGGRIRVRHLLDVLANDVGREVLEAMCVAPLEGLRVACYSGCALSRPHAEFDDPEFPIVMEGLLTSLGAEPVYFPLKAKCCGGLLMLTREEIGLALVKKLLDSAADNGAECIATACPLCQMNLENYQGEVNRAFGTDFSLPIVYFTQLVGMALGLSKEELGLGRELVSTEPLFRYLVA